jgi:hypothetical protein
MAIQQLPTPKGGIPSGNTAGRPSSPVIGDTYYDGTLGFLLIFDGTRFIPCSAPAAQPTITVADVGTNQPYTAPTATVTFTEGSAGGKAAGFTAVQGSTAATSTSSPITLTVAAIGTSLAFTGTSYNGFGTSPSSLTVNQTITSLPEVRTIGTATASASANEVTVTWTNGNNGGKNLSAITITPFLNGTTAETSRTAATTSSTSYTFTDGQLTNNAAYTFKVKATNANGTCADSTASNSATVPNFLIIDYLVVAGGGGGAGMVPANNAGGGGGAGGLRSSVTATGGGGALGSPLGLALSTNYTVTVGAGGGATAAANINGNNGSNSVFSTITSTGGGGGGCENTTGLTGGSAGGGGSPNGTAGSRTASPVQGNNGGGSGGASTFGAGGGGGAGGVGGTGTTTARGAGGAAASILITGSSVDYALGGQGGDYSVAQANGAAGTANTGNGGGGARSAGTGSAGGAGGSGIVILRYSDTRTITIGAGLTGTTSSASGGYKRTTLTAGSGNVSWA